MTDKPTQAEQHHYSALFFVRHNCLEDDTPALTDMKEIEYLLRTIPGLLARVAELEQLLLEQKWLTDSREVLADALRKQLNSATPPKLPAAPEYTTGHCTEHNKIGGCQLHNLQCGYPNCDRKPIITKSAAPVVPDNFEPVAIVKENPYCPEGLSDEITKYLPVGTALYTSPQPAVSVPRELLESVVNDLEYRTMPNNHETSELRALLSAKPIHTQIEDDKS